MEYIEENIINLNSPQLRRIIKEYRQQTLEKVPPFSRSRKVVLIDMIRKLDMIKILRKIKDTDLNDAVDEVPAVEEEAEAELHSSEEKDNKEEEESIEDIPAPPEPEGASPEGATPEGATPDKEFAEPIEPPKTHPDPVKKKVGFNDTVETVVFDDGHYTDDEDTITRYDLEQSIEDIRYDINYLAKYRPRCDELRELRKQVLLYQRYLNQNYK